MRGLYIVIEGPQGVGKSTQVQRLVNRLKNAKVITRTMREPDSQSELTARAIRTITQDPRYPMNTRTEVLLYNAARSQSLSVIRKATENGVTCIVDRNYLTTLAMQYYGRGDVPDYDTINTIISFAVADMEPDLTIVLNADATILRKRVKDRYAGERFDNLDMSLLERVVKGYRIEAQKRGLPQIDASASPDVISDKVWSLVEVALKQRANHPQKRTQSVTAAVSVKEVLEERVSAPLLRKDSQGRLNITEDGKRFLQDAVTNVDGNVYAFTQKKLTNATAAAAMARLSRRADDMRITILDEFAGSADKDEQLLRRVITAYGDDSVQQLAGLHVVVEGASNILTKKLEWGRLASYLEQSTRYIYFDEPDESGAYRFYTPPTLLPDAQKAYTDAMTIIFTLYSDVVRKVTEYARSTSQTPKNERDAAWKSATRAQACDAARSMLPAATKSTVGIFASGQALESLIMHLMSDPFVEAQETGKALLDEARKVVPVFLERADKPERGGALIAYRANTARSMRQLSDASLPQMNAPQTQQSIHLTDYWPKNELDLLPHMLYEHTQLSLDEIATHIAQWSYDEKVAAFRTYVGERLNRRHKPGRAMEVAHYSWDIVCDYGIFRDLQRHRMVDALEWQELTPRFGYEVPSLIQKAGLTEQFQQAFDISFKLYSALQSAGYHLEAQYATLFGHRMRWKVTYNARQAFHVHELRTTPQGHPGYRKLVKSMHDTLASVHPLVAESMIFVNKDEDPELTRLAAERYTQFKLQQITISEGGEKSEKKP